MTIKDPVKIKLGDTLITDCVYDTSKRTNVTWGGLSTQEEMCLAFILHYPEIRLDRCLSYNDPVRMHRLFGVKTKENIPYEYPTWKSANGQKALRNLAAVTWNNSSRKKTMNSLIRSPFRAICTSGPPRTVKYSPIKISKKYNDPILCKKP